MKYAQKHDLLFLFFLKVVVNKIKAYSILIFGIMHYYKKYYFQLECCDSIISLLSMSFEYINKTEVLCLLSHFNDLVYWSSGSRLHLILKLHSNKNADQFLYARLQMGRIMVR